MWINTSGVNSAICNEYDQYHDFTCPLRYSISHIWGHHHNGHEDRIYCYGCQNTNGRGTPRCYQTGYVNNWDNTVATLCHPNYYIAGVRSYHNNDKEDRRFNFKCCRNNGQCIRNCYLDGPANDWDGGMNYNLHTRSVIVGAFSWHRNDKE